MTTLKVVDWDKKELSTIELADEVFAATVKPHLHWEVVRWQRAKKQAGTHKAKTRSEVSGTGRKPFKQKGTGRARQGDFRSPLLRGGAVVHGPQPRSHAFSVPRKVRRGALRSALSLLMREQKVFVVKDFAALGDKTKQARTALEGFGVGRALLVDSKNENLKRSAHNLSEHKYLAAEGLNVYDLLHFGSLVISEEAAKAIDARLKD